MTLAKTSKSPTRGSQLTAAAAPTAISGASLLLVDSDHLRAIITDAVANAVAAATEENNGYLTTAEIAAHLRVKPRSIPQMVRRDGLPALKFGNAYKFRRSDVDAWCDERSVERRRGRKER